MAMEEGKLWQVLFNTMFLSLQKNPLSTKKK
jgi:hypothetical protein